MYDGEHPRQLDQRVLRLQLKRCDQRNSLRRIFRTKDMRWLNMGWLGRWEIRGYGLYRLELMSHSRGDESCRAWLFLRCSRDVPGYLHSWRANRILFLGCKTIRVLEICSVIIDFSYPFSTNSCGTSLLTSEDFIGGHVIRNSCIGQSGIALV